MDKTKTKIVQIVPRLPPYRDGVGDYSLKLAGQLLKAHGIFTEFLVFQPGIEVPSKVNGFPAKGFPTQTLETLISVLPDDINTVLLHYSNYPYIKGKIKAPFWLADTLKLAQKQRKIKVIVMFHELPMLKFKGINILNPFQSIVSRRLAQTADFVVTDSARFQQFLERWSKQTVPCIPDFSTIGEPNFIPPLETRDRRVIIFGSTDRNRIYKNFLPELLQTCRDLGIEEICDIGQSLNLNPSDFKGVRLIEKGFQSDEEVRELMLNSWAGFIDYSRFPGDLGKSSVFASFCAHGLVPISSCYNPSEADGVEMNRQYLVPGSSLKNFDISQLQTIATNAHKWYSGHSLQENANLFASRVFA
ncbi:hypothetical protein [Lusitaniella coriacea]|uniref:hypothetical protein n=1 Tax=Lusitaniella coriacea TaxID=1983105 RepID=UPI003CF8E647